MGNTLPVSIRPATAADLPAIGRLEALLVRMHHDVDPQRSIPATSRTEEAYAWFLRGGGSGSSQ